MPWELYYAMTRLSREDALYFMATEHERAWDGIVVSLRAW
jgi:hypothetical protein